MCGSSVNSRSPLAAFFATMVLAEGHSDDSGNVPVPNGHTTTPDKSGETDEYVINLLEESEALELVEFDSNVSLKDSWEHSKAISKSLEKHFNRALAESEREAIMKDFPKPTRETVTVPKLDEEVKLKRRVNNHTLVQKNLDLYKIQEHLLDVAGPFTCLWLFLFNKEANVSSGDILLLIQRSW